MKTTNLFLDFILIGFILAFFAFFAVYMAEPSALEYIYQMLKIDQISSFSIYVIFLYIVGIGFNQFSDSFIKLIGRLPFIKVEDIKKSEYHKKLQLIVIKSSTAYEYLSFRRSIIRITRVLFTSSFIFLILYCCLIVVKSFEQNVEFEIKTIIIAISVILIGLYFWKVNIRLLSGYYKAIENFYNSLNVVDSNSG
jgi:fructose-specific phosphotransferase system IIC component